MPTAQPTGWPPYVNPCPKVPSVPVCSSITLAISLSIATADKGAYPAVSCLAIEIEFGLMPNVWEPNHSPVRPNPQITSSDIAIISYFFRTFPISSK